LSNRTSVAGTALVVGAFLVLSIGWWNSFSALKESHAHTLKTVLEPMAALLHDNQLIIEELQALPYKESDKGILDSYLAKIRRDGPAKNAQMKQHLDAMADNNTTLLALIATYSPLSTTAAFMSEATKFRAYAITWRDRWNSVMETFMGGGSLPAAGIPFPVSFADAVQREIASYR
jgi:hypothetical protein